MNGDSELDKESSKVCLNGWLKHLSEDGQLKRSQRCPIALGLVLVRDFKARGNGNARVGTLCKTYCPTMGRPRRQDSH